MFYFEKVDLDINIFLYRRIVEEIQIFEAYKAVECRI